VHLTPWIGSKRLQLVKDAARGNGNPLFRPAIGATAPRLNDAARDFLIAQTGPKRVA
jgi:hypothetical protein